MRAHTAALMTAASLITGLTAFAAPAQAAPAQAEVPAAALTPTAKRVTLPSGCNPQSARGNSHLTVCFQPKGDRVWVYDGASDGRRAVAAWKGVDFGRSGHCYNTMGAGHWGYCTYDFPEDHAIGLSGYTQNGSQGSQRDILFPASFSSTS